MVDGVHTLLSPIAEEINRALVEKGAIGVAIDYVCLNGTNLAQGTVIDSCINLHAASIEHRTEQCVVFYNHLTQENGDTHQLERRHGKELDVMTIADALSHGNSDAQTCVGARTATHGNGIYRNGVAVGKRQRLVDVSAERDGMVWTLEILFAKNALAILADSHRAHICACLNM